MSEEIKPCRCKCGYTCGGPGTCTFTPFFCLAANHFVKDCDHVFSEWQEEDWGGQMLCKDCGQSSMGHDMHVGP